MASPLLEFHYDISCPFAYIASTRIESLASRTGATLIWRPVLLGAIYRATSAPQGAAGSASDVFNSAKKAMTAASMQRTLKRYKIKYNPPPKHPRKTVNALRLLYAVTEEERQTLSKVLFKAYWVDGKDVSDDDELLRIVNESGLNRAEPLSREVFGNAHARQELEKATADAIERGAFGVPGFWLPGEQWTNLGGESRNGRFYWGQDRMHFVEASLLAQKNGGRWDSVSNLKGLLPRCSSSYKVSNRVKVEFWFDFSSPWAFLGWTQLERLRRTYGDKLDIVMKPFLLGILFREIGAPNLPSSAISPAKAIWARQDHNDWTRFWNAVNAQEGCPDKCIEFHWADIFPIRTPTLLRCAIVEPGTVPLLYRACWEKNLNVADDHRLVQILDNGGYNGSEILEKANAKDAREQLRKLTAEAKELGLCGAPSYRILRQSENGRWDHVEELVWGQDELNVVEDLLTGWTVNDIESVAIPGRAATAHHEKAARL